MTWSTRLALSLLSVLLSQAICALGQANTPWSSKANADAFIQAFMKDASQSGAFSSDQIDDMSMISNTILSAIENMGGVITQHKLQALNMAFASSVAEIALTEGQDVGVITNAITNALQSAFYQTTGVVNNQFINEIRSLISMFRKTSASGLSYDSSSSGIYSPSSSSVSVSVPSAPNVSNQILNQQPASVALTQQQPVIQRNMWTKPSISVSEQVSYSPQQQISYSETVSYRPGQSIQSSATSSGTISGSYEQDNYGQSGSENSVAITAGGTTQRKYDQDTIGSSASSISGYDQNMAIQSGTTAAVAIGNGVYQAGQTGYGQYGASVAGNAANQGDFGKWGFGQDNYDNRGAGQGNADFVAIAANGIGQGSYGPEQGSVNQNSYIQSGYEQGSAGQGGDRRYGPASISFSLPTISNFDYPTSAQQPISIAQANSPISPSVTVTEQVTYAPQRQVSYSETVPYIPQDSTKTVSVPTATGADEASYGQSGQGPATVTIATSGLGPVEYSQGASGATMSTVALAGGADQGGYAQGSAGQGGAETAAVTTFGSARQGNQLSYGQEKYVQGGNGQDGIEAAVSVSGGIGKDGASAAARNAGQGGQLTYGQKGYGGGNAGQGEAGAAAGSSCLGGQGGYGQGGAGQNGVGTAAAGGAGQGGQGGYSQGGAGQGASAAAAVAGGASQGEQGGYGQGGYSQGGYGQGGYGQGGYGQGGYGQSGFGQEGAGQGVATAGQGNTGISVKVAGNAGQGDYVQTGYEQGFIDQGKGGQVNVVGYRPSSASISISVPQVSRVTYQVPVQQPVSVSFPQQPLTQTYSSGPSVTLSEQVSYAPQRQVSYSETVSYDLGVSPQSTTSARAASKEYVPDDNSYGQETTSTAMTTTVSGGQEEYRQSGSESAAASGIGRIGYNQGSSGQRDAALAVSGGGGQRYYGTKLVAAPAAYAASALATPDSSARISSLTSSLLSTGPTNAASISNVISNSVSQISSNNPGVSACDVLVQAVLELVTALLSIIGSSNIGDVNYDSASQYAQMVSQSVQNAFI